MLQFLRDDIGSSLNEGPFWFPKRVRHPYTKDPKWAHKSENYTYGNTISSGCPGHLILSNLGEKV